MTALILVAIVYVLGIPVAAVVVSYLNERFGDGPHVGLALVWPFLLVTAIVAGTAVAIGMAGEALLMPFIRFGQRLARGGK